MQDVISIILDRLNKNAGRGIKHVAFVSIETDLASVKFHEALDKVKEQNLMFELESTANNVGIAMQAAAFRVGFKTALELVFQLISIGTK